MATKHLAVVLTIELVVDNARKENILDRNPVLLRDQLCLPKPSTAIASEVVGPAVSSTASNFKVQKIKLITCGPILHAASKHLAAKSLD
jgi:hypothetical protein